MWFYKIVRTVPALKGRGRNDDEGVNARQGGPRPCSPASGETTIYGLCSAPTPAIYGREGVPSHC